MKIGVIGCGAYSLAISIMLNKNNNDILFGPKLKIKLILQKFL